MSQWAVELPGHSAHLVHANKALIARSKRELAATAMVILHLGSSVIAFIGLLGGLFALGTYPIGGVLLTLGAMALLLYSVAVLCGANSPSRH
jgi:ABC-type polysaccharide/polyol phosphate export permease